MAKNNKPTTRPAFIEELKAYIVKNCPLPEAQTREAIALWEAGKNARHPMDAAVFAVCEKIRADIDAQ